MLKALLLRSKIDGLAKRLTELKAGDEDREKRAAELAADVAELTAKEDATDEERAAVETAVNDFDAEAAQAEADKADLQRQIDELQRELDSLEEKQPKPAAPAEEPAKPESNERILCQIELQVIQPRAVRQCNGNTRVAPRDQRQSEPQRPGPQG